MKDYEKFLEDNFLKIDGNIENDNDFIGYTLLTSVNYAISGENTSSISLSLLLNAYPKVIIKSNLGVISKEFKLVVEPINYNLRFYISPETDEQFIITRDDLIKVAEYLGNSREFLEDNFEHIIEHNKIDDYFGYTNQYDSMPLYGFQGTSSITAGYSNIICKLDKSDIGITNYDDLITTKADYVTNKLSSNTVCTSIEASGSI